MDWSEVVRQIEAGEGPRTEFESRFDRCAIGKAVCAFANSEGGLVVLGVDDSGSIVGVNEDPEGLAARLRDSLQSEYSSPVTAMCGRHQTCGHWVHWIDVFRIHDLPPVRHDGRYWIRLNGITVEPSGRRLQELFKVFGFALTESQVILDSEIEEIDTATFHLFLRSRGIELKSRPQHEMVLDLLNHHAIKRVGERFATTIYGLMVFGRHPQQYPHTTNFFVRCVAYRGNERGTDAYSVSDATGTIDSQVELAMAWFRSLGRREIYSGLYRRDLPFAPERLLREALVNAVIHRDYAITSSKVMFEIFDSHIVITSPGSLPDDMTVEQVKAGVCPRSRNESMAHSMVVRGLMSQRGCGWPSMRSGMREFNGTEPELVNDKLNRFVRVTFHLDSSIS